MIRAVITATPLAYTDGDTPLSGEFYLDESQPGPRPGILLVHGGAGLDEHARQQARRYAALGYAVFACDMFGDGVAGDRDRIIQRVTGLRDEPAQMVRLARAGLTALSRCPDADGRMAVIGFCFGGLVALQLARSGEPLAAAASIHGSLTTSVPAQPGQVTASVLVCHGALDPHVPLADVTAFADEMSAAGADWQLIIYGGAQHGFTHAHAKPGTIPGVAYHEQSDTRSFAATRDFLARAFAAQMLIDEPSARPVECSRIPSPARPED